MTNEQPAPTAGDTVPVERLTAASTAGGSPTPPAAPGRPAAPPLTGGQRASAILGGLAGHLLFAIGWFGIAGLLFAPAFGGLVNDLLGNLFGDPGSAEQFREALARASALLWLVGVVFLVGSTALVVFGILVAQLVLGRGEVPNHRRVNLFAFVLAAIVDVPVYLLMLWLASLITDASTGLVFLPPIIALVLAAAIGVVGWWWLAHLNRVPRLSAGRAARTR